MRRWKAYLLSTAAALLVAACIFISGCGEKQETLAIVNGEPVTADDLLLAQGNTRRDALANAIERKLVFQWAKEKQAMATDEQVDRMIGLFRHSGAYDKAVSSSGVDVTREGIATLQTLVNLAKNCVTIINDPSHRPGQSSWKGTEISLGYKLRHIPDKDLQAFYNDKKKQVGWIHGQRKHIEIIVNSSKQKMQEAAKLIEKGTTFDDVGNVFSENNGKKIGVLKTWIDGNTEALPKKLWQVAQKTEVGKVSDVFSVPDGEITVHVILKVTQDQPAENLKFEEVREEVKDLIALSYAKGDEVLHYPIVKYFHEQVNDRYKKAYIEIKAEGLEDVADEIKRRKIEQDKPYRLLLRYPLGW